MTRRPRLGFLGLGWIGRHRMQAVIEAGLAEVVAFAEPSPDAAAEAVRLVPGIARADGLEGLLALGLDGVVIATPSALHAKQAVRALEHGVAVFCQKPLGRDAHETAGVVEAAQAADRLLGVDLSYRTLAGMAKIRQRVQSGGLGRIFAVDLTFHNAYGPDKPWFYDPAQSGGGCVIDLGVHLVDLALWTLGFPAVTDVAAQRFAEGMRLSATRTQVEDYATATLELASGAVVRLTCSWRLHAGQDAVIGAAFHGTQGGATLRNVAGSFYDFVAEVHRGTGTERIAGPPDAWGGRAVVAWAASLAAGQRFDTDARHFVTVAEVLDRIYAA